MLHCVLLCAVVPVYIILYTVSKNISISGTVCITFGRKVYIIDFTSYVYPTEYMILYICIYIYIYMLYIVRTTAANDMPIKLRLSGERIHFFECFFVLLKKLLFV